ncbi:hypothetical protein BD413DRAFT_676463 [Trametes elegans]|nr:hypothetical protein BD413DRAFT_676463 [Trametes elegans]
MATKNLTFRRQAATYVDIGDDVSLMLCFTPPTPELFIKQFPVAWRVTTLSAKGRSVLEATWTSTLGFCMPQIGGNSRIVSSGTYTPINVGEVTTLTVNKNAKPPVYYFTDPVALPGTDNVQAINKCGHPSTIGLGFITDVGTTDETMSPILTWDEVGNGLTVTGEFTPVLRAYVALKYQASDIIRGEIRSHTPIWEKNLLSLAPDTVIHISKDPMGGYVARTGGVKAQDTPLVPSVGWKNRLYRADLAFASPKIALQAARAVGEHLSNKSYTVKFIYKDGDEEAQVELALPRGVSCQQAEREMLAALEDDPLVAHRAQIKGHSGQVLLAAAGTYAQWSNINPATVGWYTTGKDNAITTRSVNGALAREAAFDGFDDGATTAAPSPKLLGVDNGNFGNGRTLSRRASSVNLAN